MIETASDGLSYADRQSLSVMRMEREVRGVVRGSLLGSHVHPVALDIRLAHPWLQRLGLGHNGHYQLTLALKKGDTIPEEKLQSLNESVVEWGQSQIPPVIMDLVRVKRAGILDQINGSLQMCGNGGNL